jgi:hypothetical protein
MRLPFKPVCTVTDPSGRQWELYLTKTALPEWREGGYNSLVDDPEPFLGILNIPLMLIGFLWSSILSPALRFLLLYPYALVKGRRSRAARVEAICFSTWDGTMTHTWTTTADQAESVLHTVALALEEGRIAEPVGAVYAIPASERTSSLPDLTE